MSLKVRHYGAAILKYFVQAKSLIIDWHDATIFGFLTAVKGWPLTALLIGFPVIFGIFPMVQRMLDGFLPSWLTSSDAVSAAIIFLLGVCLAIVGPYEAFLVRRPLIADIHVRSVEGENNILQAVLHLKSRAFRSLQNCKLYIDDVSNLDLQGRVSKQFPRYVNEFTLQPFGSVEIPFLNANLFDLPGRSCFFIYPTLPFLEGVIMRCPADLRDISLRVQISKEISIPILCTVWADRMTLKVNKALA
jgi:hypothetical protein